MFQQAIINMPEATAKHKVEQINRKPRQREHYKKKKSDGKFRTKKYDNGNFFKSSINELNRRIKRTDEQIRELGNRTIEMTRSERQRENRLKKN